MTRFIWVVFSMFAGVLWCQQGAITLRPNRGQWDSRIDYTIGLQGGNMYVEQTGFTYFFYQFDGHNHGEIDNHEITANCVKSVFLNAKVSVPQESGEKSYYRNYFLGSDPANWKAKIFDVAKVRYPGKYEHIDLEIETGTEQAKYSWIIYPGGNVNDIRWQYDGASGAEITPTGQLRVNHSSGYFVEGTPKAWRYENGEQVEVRLEYVQKHGKYGFKLLDEVPAGDTLVIDPSLTFSSFTGSQSDNWGYTAAPDPTGNLYAGGIVFGSAYPVTTGSVGQVFNGGTSSTGAPITSPLHNGFDVALSKFNAAGTAFIFSTYLGGSGNETPHSIVSDANGNMYLLGVTSSPNFPTLSTCYDNTFNSGPTVEPDNLKFIGSDIYVIELNPTGTAVLASTFVGGSGSDGINFGTLQYNYGDNFRGEIIVDDSFVYFSSVTQSADFPVVSASQPNLNGVQDAVVVKMTKNLSSIVWSTYYGGSGDESGNGIQLSGNGSVYVAGGTNNGGLNLGLSGWDNTYHGNRDGFLLRLDATTGALLNGTYIGTSDYDQSYFVQIDVDNDVYVFGQTAGNWAITPGRFGVANSGQYIMKFDPTLTTQHWVTTVGAGSGNIEISPTAFLVSYCKDIYLSGWGGIVNQQNSQAVTSSSFNFPVTSDAFQSTTNGNNFWIAVLSENASSLKYATYMGGSNSSYNHVDGGTSRFDKNGNIYHAVCGACGGNNTGFTTTPGVVGPENLSVNCNLAAFKFVLSSIDATVSAPTSIVCIPNPVVFQNGSTNGNSYSWTFGDGTGSTQISPSHSYTSAGQYTVKLVVTDTANCYASDSVEFMVNIGDFNGGVTSPQVQICEGQSAQLEAYGGSVYSWSPAQFLNNATIANPLATVTQNTTFTCVISDSCGVDTVTVDVVMLTGGMQVSNDTIICLGESVPLAVNGVDQASWTPAQYLDDPNSLTPVSTPANTITYEVNGTTIDGCAFKDSVTIEVDLSQPSPVMPDTLRYCLGGSGDVTVSGARSYSWSPGSGISTTTGPSVTIFTQQSTYYYCDFSNSCGTVRDSIYVSTSVPAIVAGNDTTICPGETALLFARGGDSYVWSPSVYTLINPDGSLVEVKPVTNTTYSVIGYDNLGCSDTTFVTVSLFPTPFVQTCPDVYAVFGETVQLSATSTQPGTYVWSPAEYLSCSSCQNPLTQPDKNMTYTVTFYDNNGCEAKDVVSISYEPLIYVPNTFTPNANGVNEFFFAKGVNLKDFKLEIYDRWGERIFTANSISEGWDGTYAGLPSPDGVYTWKIEYSDIYTAKRYRLVGHVTLLR